MAKGKVCKKCGEFKSFEDYYKSKSNKDGLQSWCKVCEKQRSKKKYKEKNADKRKKYHKAYIMADRKVCYKCGEFKSFGEFYKHKKTKDGLYPWCKVCEKQRSIEYHQKNPDIAKEYSQKNADKIKEYRKEYNQNNAENIKEIKKQYFQTEHGRQVVNDASARRSKRTKAVGGHFLTWQKKIIFKRDKGVCQCCSKTLTMKAKQENTMAIDHVIAVTWGGKSHIDNGMLLCKSCNSSKNNKFNDEYFLQVMNIINKTGTPIDEVIEFSIMNQKLEEYFDQQAVI